MAIRQAYESAVKAHGLVADEAQQRIVDRLDRLQREIIEQKSVFGRLRRWLPRTSDHPKMPLLCMGDGSNNPGIRIDLFCPVR